MEYSLGELVDMLSVVNVKMYHMVDIVEQSSDDNEVAKISRKLASLNRQRSELKNAINKAIGSNRVEIKT